MFSRGLIAAWAGSVVLVFLSAVALPSAGTAADGHGALAEAGDRQPTPSWRNPETSGAGRGSRPLSAMGNYSDEQIRLLNLRLAVPLKLDQLKAEFSSLQVLHLRFNRRYGADSVASKSVRDRLELLRVALRSGR